MWTHFHQKHPSLFLIKWPIKSFSPLYNGIWERFLNKSKKISSCEMRTKVQKMLSQFFSYTKFKLTNLCNKSPVWWLAFNLKLNAQCLVSVLPCKTRAKPVSSTGEPFQRIPRRCQSRPGGYRHGISNIEHLIVILWTVVFWLDGLKDFFIANVNKYPI